MTTCIAAHDQDPPQAEPGLMLCRRCTQRLHRHLAHIVGLWGVLAVMLTPGGTTGGSHGKPGSRPPLALDIVDITDPRGQTHAQIAGWARIVIEERRLADRPLDTEQAARLLAVHADWVAAQPWADEALMEIGQAAHRIRRACRDLPDPPVGTCPDIDPRGETDMCGGPLRWDDGSTTVRCARCGSTWAEADLPHILRVVQPTRRFPVERDWVAARYGVTDGQLRTWVWRGQVRTFGDRQVDLFDVLARITEG